MKVIQVCINRSHHFNLARQLNKHNNLDLFYTGYPKFKLKDEEYIPPYKVKSIPYFQTPFMFFDRYQLWPYEELRNQISFLAHQNLDWVVKNNLKEAVILISYCGAGFYSFKLNKELGGINICDKGSTHIEFQDEILREEFLRYGKRFKGVYKKRIIKEVEEYEICDFITVPSKFVFNSFIKKGIAKEKLKLIPYGARISRFKPRIKEKNDNLDTKNKNFTILFVGKFGARKGAIDILEAFKRFNHPNKTLIIIGTISNEAKNLFKNYDTSKIKFLGTIRNHLIVDYYQKSNVLLIPSIEEGSAIVTLEALACGCPVIATPNAGSEHIENGINGFIVPIHSPDEICECLYRIADSKQLQEKLEINSVNTIKKINGWDYYGDEWNKMLNSIKKV